MKNYKAKDLNGFWINGDLVETKHEKFLIDLYLLPILTIPIERFKEIQEETLCRRVNITDKNNVELYSNDIIHDGNRGLKFRIFEIGGGFVIKSGHWSNDFNWVDSDELIVESLSDAQTRSYVKQNCMCVGNYFNKK